MKKIIIIFILLCLGSLSAFAVDVIPASSKSIKNYGVGILKIEKDFDVYSEPKENSKKLGHFTMQNTKSAIIETTGQINPFIIEIPSQKDYFVTIYEYPSENWIKIYFNKKGNETGWIKIKDKSNFMTWKEFMLKYGKANGLKIMRDVPSTEYILYAQADENAKIADEFIYPEHIACRMIQGNWMLITVDDSGKEYKTGWFQWRTSDGKLRLFPNMKEKF